MRSTKRIERILKQLLKDYITNDEKTTSGLGKYIEKARENNILSVEIINSLNSTNEIRKKAAHDKDVELEEKDAKKVYFSLAKLIYEINPKTKLSGICFNCLNDWSTPKNNLCINCANEKKEIDDVHYRLRKRINEKMMDIRKSLEFIQNKYVETKNTTHKGGIPIYKCIEEGGDVTVINGRNVIGKKNPYFRQNKIIDELHKKLKKSALNFEKQPDDYISYEIGFIIGDVTYHEFLSTEEEYMKLEKNKFFIKPKEDYEELKVLLGEKIIDKIKIGYERESEQEKGIRINIMAMIEIFYLVSLIHKQITSLATIKRIKIESKNFLSSSDICDEKIFNKLFENIEKLAKK